MGDWPYRRSLTASNLLLPLPRKLQYGSIRCKAPILSPRLHRLFALMPLVPSKFKPPAFLKNGHTQTVLGALMRRKLNVVFEHERLELEDGDFLDLRWLRKGSKRLAILSHGLEGCADDCSIRGMAAALADAGWDVLAWNFRSCGGEPNRLLRFYHSGETGDLDLVVAHAAACCSQMALVGFSLGGNLTLKYLGEAAALHRAIIAAAAISAPIDLAASARALDQRWGNRLYLRRFLTRLVLKVEAKALRFPDQLDVHGSRSIRSFQQFDDRYTAPVHGFRNAADYWKQASARQYLPRIKVPSLLLNALNDPFLTPECFPFREAELNPCLFLEAPESGGHIGFMDFSHGRQPWSERRVADFLSHAAGH